MFALRKLEMHPIAILKREGPGQKVYSHVKLPGKYHRVFPVSGKEVMALRMLVHQEEKYAPAEGNGILVTDAAMSKYI